MAKILQSIFMLGVFFSGFGWWQVASAASADEVKLNIYSALNIPLPMTVIGPLVSQDVLVEGDGDSYSVLLKATSLMGFLPLGDIPFTLTVQDEESYRITDMKLPSKIQISGLGELRLHGTTFSGLWNTKQRSYQQLEFGLTGVEFIQPQNTDVKVSLGALNLAVAKEGSGDHQDSDFSIAAKAILIEGMVPESLHIDDVKIQVIADANQPVDIYGILSKFLMSSVMTPDASKTASLLQSLANETYDKLQLLVDAKGFQLSALGANEPLAEIDSISGQLDFANINPEHWRHAKLVFVGQGIDLNEFADLQSYKMKSGEFELSLADVPIQNLLTAVNVIKPFLHGTSYSFNSAPLVEGLLNIGQLQLAAKAEGLALTPNNKFAPKVSFDKAEYRLGFDDFKPQANESISLNVALNNFSLGFAENNFKEIEQQRFTTFVPQNININSRFSELNADLLRELFADIDFHSQNRGAEIVAPLLTYLSSLRLVGESKDMLYETAVFSLSGNAKSGVVPMWALSINPGEGETNLTLEGMAELKQYLSQEEAQIASIIKSGLNTLEVLAKAEGDSLSWQIQTPERQPYILVNDQKLYLPTGLLNYTYLPYLLL
jgi:hypothetical protein